MFRKFFKITLDVVQMEKKQRPSLVWSLDSGVDIHCDILRRRRIRVMSPYISMRTLNSDATDIAHIIHMTYRWQSLAFHVSGDQSEPKRLKNSKQQQHERILKQAFDRGCSTGNPIANRPLVHFETECVLSGGKKGTIIPCLFACILPSSTIMLQTGQQAPLHQTLYHLQ